MQSVRENPEAYERGELWWQALEYDLERRPRYWRGTTARKIPINRRSVTGRNPSLKVGRMVGFESTLERDLFERLEFDFAVTWYQEQPLSIPYTCNGFDVAYIPDVLVRFAPEAERHPALMEVKYSEDLARNWEEYRPRFAAAGAYARDHCLDFVVNTEREIRTAYLRNAKLLLPYRHIAIEKELAFELVAEAARRPHTFATLLAYAKSRTDGRLADIAILYLLARGCLLTNFDRAIDDAAKLERGRADP